MDHEDVFAEVLEEFEANIDGSLDDETRETARRLYDRTLGRALAEGVVRWEEPIRSFALHHTAKIGRYAGRNAGAGPISADLLAQAAEAVFERARQARWVLTYDSSTICE